MLNAAEPTVALDRKTTTSLAYPLSHVNIQLSLVCWYHLFTMCIPTNIYGSVAFPVLMPIDMENPLIIETYWIDNIVFLNYWTHKYHISECAVDHCRVGDIRWPRLLYINSFIGIRR